MEEHSLKPDSRLKISSNEAYPNAQILGDRSNGSTMIASVEWFLVRYDTSRFTSVFLPWWYHIVKDSPAILMLNFLTKTLSVP